MYRVNGACLATCYTCFSSSVVCQLHCTGKKAGRRLAGADGEENEEDEEDDDVEPGGSNPFAALADLKGAVNAAEFVPHRCDCLSTAARLSTSALCIFGHGVPAILPAPFWWGFLSVSRSLVHVLLYARQNINAYRLHNLLLDTAVRCSLNGGPISHYVGK